MLVSLTSLGSVWRYRFNQDQNNPQLFSRGVFYNTTGVCIAGRILQRPRILGYARFHQCSGFNPHYPLRMLGRVFDCAEPCVWEGTNRLLFQRALRKPELPQRFLVVTRPEVIGRVHIGGMAWRSPETWLISFSEDGERQEAMLLMSVGSSIITDLGRFALMSDQDRPWLARLILTA